ncbi:MAG: cytochrome c [Candidatus Manganitrophus sp.]|nr:cytochrome c [Candidatus Manganitrophus sp.]WDT79269.1 MAG: cytochrome c [Candidatus Manganitrophus sp.]
MGRSDWGTARSAAIWSSPFNLQADQTRRRPAKEIYEIVTDGRIVMPAFKGVLSAEERWAVAYFVKSFGGDQG